MKGVAGRGAGDHVLHGGLLGGQGVVELIVTAWVSAPYLEHEYNQIKVQFLSDSIFNHPLLLNRHTAHVDVIFTSGVRRTYVI